MRPILACAALIVCSVATGYGQRNFDITRNSVGGIKLGMTIDQARQTLRSCRFKRTSDGEGAALIGVRCSAKEIVTIFAGEEDVEAPINEKAKIEFIEVWDKRFKTKQGVHKGMLVSEIEKRLGTVTKIILTEIESREFVTFRRKQAGIYYRIYGGIYAPGETTTTRYQPRTRLWSIQVSRY